FVTSENQPGKGQVRYGTSPGSLAAVAYEGGLPPGTPTPTSYPFIGARGDVHLVSISNLAASTTYYFDVGSISGNNPWGTNNSQHYVAATTAAGGSIPSLNSILTGTIRRSDNSVAVGDVILVKVANTNGSGDTGESQYMAAAQPSSGKFSVLVAPF